MRKVQRKEGRKKSCCSIIIILIQHHTPITDQCIMTQKYSWLNSLHPATFPSRWLQQSSQICLLFTLGSVQQYGKQWAARWRDHCLDCLRHRRWGHCVCVGGRPEFGWCVWKLELLEVVIIPFGSSRFQRFKNNGKCPGTSKDLDFRFCSPKILGVLDLLAWSGA